MLLLATIVLAATLPQPAAPSGASRFEDLSRRAAAARDSGRLDEASRLYREALRARPGWEEGLWSLGTIAYELDRLAECRDVMRRLVAARPALGSAWVFRGLCEFRLGEHAAALRHVEEGLRRPPLDGEDLERIALYHHAVLLVREGRFERAIEPLTRVVRVRAESDELREACGLLALREPRLPAEVPAGERDLVRRAGAAYCAFLAGRGAQARALYEPLLADHPRREHLHYAYGLALAQLGAPEAADAFRREIALHPGHVLAHLELAFELQRRGRAAEAVVPARVAVRLAPGLFAARLALGRALVDGGDVTAGVAELEAAARLEPAVAETHFALAAAYDRAGRRSDAERARAEFARLDARRRAGPGAGAAARP